MKWHKSRHQINGMEQRIQVTIHTTVAAVFLTKNTITIAVAVTKFPTKKSLFGLIV